MRVGMRRWRRRGWPKQRCGMPMRGLPAISRPGSGRVGAAALNRASSPPMSWRCMLRGQPYPVRCLVARARRMATALPTVWEAFRRGEMDAEQMRVIDRVARRVTETATLAAIDEQAVDAADTRSPKQLQVWLLRLVVQLEPLAFAQRHRRALAERRVTVVQGTDGIGYVTGEVSAADAAAIDALLAATSRSLGAEDPRTDQQRRADLFADLLLGRIGFDQPDDEAEEEEEEEEGGRGGRGGTDPTIAGACESARRETIRTSPSTAAPPRRRQTIKTSPSTAEASASAVERRIGWRSRTSTPTPGSCWAPICNASTRTARPIGEPVDPICTPTGKPSLRPRVIKRPRTIRIGVVVPLASLLDASETPGELADRSGFIPGEILKDQISDALGSNDGGPGVVHPAAHRQRRPTPRRHRTRPPPLSQARRSHQHPGRQLPIPHLHRARRPVRPGSPPTSARTAKPPAETWIRSAADTTAAKPSPGLPHTETIMASTGPCPTPNTTDASTNHYPPDEPRKDQRKDQLLQRAIDPHTCAARS